ACPGTGRDARRPRLLDGRPRRLGELPRRHRPRRRPYTGRAHRRPQAAPGRVADRHDPPAFAPAAELLESNTLRSRLTVPLQLCDVSTAWLSEIRVSPQLLESNTPRTGVTWM